MTEEVKAFENDENRKRSRMPAVFSVSGIRAEDATKFVAIECKTLVAKILETFKEWAA
jgi:hypothetical protein